MYETIIHSFRVRVVYDDICKARADAIVNPVDNHISGYSQLARTLIDMAGIGVQYEISLLRQDKIAHGDIVLTSGGALFGSTIIHAIVFDRELQRGPNGQLVSALTHRCLEYAERKRALSIAFPVLGGDQMSKDVHTELFTAMAQAIGVWCRQKRRSYPSAINIYVTTEEILDDVRYSELFKRHSEADMHEDR